MNLNERKDIYSIIYVCLALFTIYTFLRMIIRPFDEETFTYISDVEVLILALLAGIFSFTVAMKYNLNTDSGKIWLFIALGNIFWALGEFSYAFYEIILKSSDPYTGSPDIYFLIPEIPLFIGDFFWLLGYPIFFMGLFLEFKIIDIEIKRKDIYIYAFFYLILAFIVIIFLIFPILIYEEIEIAEKIVTILYPLMDLILLVFIGLVFLKLRGVKIAFPWILLLMAFFITSLADTWYGYLEWNETYGKYHPVDFLFVLDYVLSIAAATEMYRILTKPKTIEIPKV